MKFTLSWLKDHLDTKASPKEIADKLTAIGLEVESVSDPAAALAPFTAAEILHAEKHPDADKLRVCRVLSDAGELQIVCGAPNARAGIKVALAKEGAVIPANGMVIKKSKIRGVESNGMLCSAEELGLTGDYADGIIELPLDTKVGTPVAAALGLDDPLFDINVTPNRGDALSVHGIARDLAAAGLGILKALQAKPIEGTFDTRINLQVENTSDCPLFIGYEIRGVTNRESPDWLKKRLISVGQKPISALVDITNFMTLAYGRPLHAYDADKLNGSIVVKRGEGIAFTALNNMVYTPQAEDIVIGQSGSSEPLGFAGIIGGVSTGCTLETQNVFLEAALFDAVRIALTGQRYAILSDARYRFERGVDPAFVADGALIAVQMILDICGGQASRNIKAGEASKNTRQIAFNPDRASSLGGVEIAPEKAVAILGSLGFSCEASGSSYTVTPPSFRPDIEGEADLVEEILRIHGYDAIPEAPLPSAPQRTAPLDRASLAKRLLAGRGMLEACTFSFVSHETAQRFGGAPESLRLLNPISADLDQMRPSLLPNLLDAAMRNARRGMADSALFEVGLTFHEGGQKRAACGLRCGEIVEQSYAPGSFRRQPRPVDAFDAKADALALLAALGLNKCDITAGAPDWYHPGRSGTLALGKNILGHFGELHPALLEERGMDKPAAAFELALDALPQSRAKGKARPALHLSDVPAVSRDFAFTLDASVKAAELLRVVQQADKQLITSTGIFDVYTGKGVAEGKQSVAVQVTLQGERTLTDQDIQAASEKIVAAVSKAFGAQLRQ